MEGVGSRLGRASSRYGPATTVFNGPVRRWKKMWVHASSSSVLKHQSTRSQSNAHKLFLCRWTPVPTSSAADSDAVDTAPEEPPRRKFRYTPITVVEEQKNAALKKVEYEGKRRLAVATMAEEVPEKPNINLNFEEETMQMQGSGKRLSSLNDANHSDLDLGLCLNG